MTRQTAINTTDDMRWLRKAHLPQLPVKYKSAIIVGNEDYPNRIEVYERKDPRITDVPVIFEADDEGVFRETRRTSSTRHHAAKKSPAELDREIAEALGHSTGPDAAGEAKRTSNLHATIAKSRPWQGTDSNERLINRVHNALVSIYLDGVAGVSPVIGEYAWKQIQPDNADAYLQKGNEVLDVLVSQKVPPSARSWYAHNVKQLRNLIEKAQAVRDGVTRQKMTAESYAELRRSLGLR